MEFAISQPKVVRLPRNEKQTYGLNSVPQMWPSGLTLGMTLTLNFHGETEIATSQPNMDRFPPNIEQTRRLTWGHQMCGHDLDLESSRSNTGFAISQLKWSNCHETKSKHIDWTQGLKRDHYRWPWTWPWPLFFKVKYVICCFSAQNGPIATKREANISIEH